MADLQRSSSAAQRDPHTNGEANGFGELDSRNEDTFQRWFEDCDLVGLSLDDHLMIVDCNTTASQFLGLGDTDLLGTALCDRFMLHADRERVRRVLMRAFETGKAPGPFEAGISASGHAVRTVRWVGAFRPGDTEHPPTLSLLGEDVTLREHAYEWHKRHLDELQTLVDNATNVISRHTPTGVYTYVSPFCSSMLGYEPAEMLGRSQYDFVHPDDVEDAIRMHSALLSLNPFRSASFRMCRKDGSYVWVEATARGVADRNEGFMTEFVCVTRDIEERMRIAEALRQSERRFRAAAEGSQDAFYLLRPLRGPSGSLLALRFVYANAVGGEMLGAEADCLIDADALELLTWLPETELFSALMQAWDSGEPSEREEMLKVRDRPPRWVRYQIVPLEDTLCLTLRDNTHERQLQHRLLQSQKLESVGRLAGGVAHDFNNLLSAILGYGELAQHELESGTQPQRRIEQMMASANQASELVQQLLAFARRQTMRRVPVDLREVIRSTEPILATLLGPDMRLDVDIQPGDWYVESEPAPMQQVLVNLAVNARDATEGHGKVAISLERVDTPEGPMARVIVTDDGPGMDEMTRSQAFEPFFTTKEPGRGTGLGLPTCYGIVVQSGGTMWIESSPGHGTRVHYDIPLTTKRPRPEYAEAPPERRIPRGLKALVVEDQEDLRAIYSDVLRGAGFEVLEAENGEEALEIGRTTSLDLMVTDVLMPRIGGEELHRELSRHHPSLKTVFVTGMWGKERVEGSHQSLRWLRKPLRPSELLREVGSLLAGHA